MTRTALLAGKDLSSFEPEPDAAQVAWLARLQRHLRTSDHVIRLGDPVDDDDHDLIVSSDAAGRWRAGRYIGEVRFEGRILRIEPRLGMPAIERLLAGATNLVALPGSTASRSTEAFIARLMAAVWCRQFDQAVRHGPPAFRRTLTTDGLHVRGHLDVRRTARLRGAGSTHVASTTRGRDLDNHVSRTLVCAARILTQQIGDEQWQTRRARAIMPLLRSAVGSRPRLPSESDLRRVRYTPITRPFQDLAALSWRIARLEGFASTADDGRADGLLLDVAELWELYVLHCVRAAAAGLRVVHGTTDADRVHLLRSRDHFGRGMGRLLPDVLVFADDGSPVLVADAKYKRVNDSAERPTGVDRGDLYQLSSYLARYASTGEALGALIYPGGELTGGRSTAVDLGPWTNMAGNDVTFMRLSVDEREAVTQIRALLAVDELEAPPPEYEVESAGGAA